MNRKALIFFITIISSILIGSSANGILVEEIIRSGDSSTAELIVPNHPRIWLKGSAGWDKDTNGSFAWRIMHGASQGWPWENDPANDQSKLEFEYCAGANDSSAYGADNMYQSFGSDFGWRVLEFIIAGKAVQLGWQSSYGGTWTLDHTADQYLADARSKLLNLVNMTPSYEAPYIVCLYGATAYDWLYNETYTDGNPVLSESDKNEIRTRLLVHADYLRNRSPQTGKFFDATSVDNFFYAMVGMALYEPSLIGDSGYASINTKTEQYLDDFDTYFIGQVLVALNEQGGDGGWHGGISKQSLVYYLGGLYESTNNVVPIQMAPVLFAHYTATDQAFNTSLYSTGVLKHYAEFQLHMIRPDTLNQMYNYDPGVWPIGGQVSQWGRSQWVAPMRAYARRRFCSDQQDIGELGAWIRTSFGKGFTDYGSWDMLDQLLFEDKWVNPRDPEAIGFSTTRYFEKLGWAFLRSGFTSPNDVAALFICQRYHWSNLDPYAQNSISIYYKADLIEGFQNTIRIDGSGQRTISQFPSVSQGVAAYSPGSVYDVGPGISDFTNASENYVYLKADATNAYDAAKIDTFTRQIVYIKPDTFVIFDKVVTKNTNYTIEWSVDPGAAPVDIGGGVYTITSGGGMLWVKRLLPATATTTNTSNDFSFTPTGSDTTAYFCVVMQTADSGSGASHVSADNATVILEGDWYRVQVGGHQLSFNKIDGFEFDGDSPSTRPAPPTNLRILPN
jgi:hypothetical protein